MARSRPSARKHLGGAGAAAIEAAIRTIRGERVIVDADLARIYGVETRVLKQAVRRNREKFPSDFLFELTSTEAVANSQTTPDSLDPDSRSQVVILKWGGNVKHVPFAFTEHGDIMAANIQRIMALLEPPAPRPEPPPREMGFHSSLALKPAKT